MDEDTTDSQDQQAEPRQARRRPGRPRKWGEQRRIEPIYEGRMSFKPGDPHPMDAQVEEAQKLREAIREQIEALQGLMIELGKLEDPGVAVSQEEQAIKSLLWRLYGTFKHRDHVVATFLTARRRRVLQRLQAAGAALELVRAFLTADASLLPLLQKTIAEAEAHATRLHGPPPPVPEANQEQAADEEDLAGDQGGPPTSGAPGAQPPEGDADQEQRRILIDTATGGDDAAATRAALAEFEERVRLMRNAIAQGHGSFEWYYIPKPRKRLPEATEYLLRGEPLPEGMQEYDDGDPGAWGPYLRYRWWEGRHRYSIGLGRVRGNDPDWSDEPPAL